MSNWITYILCFLGGVTFHKWFLQRAKTYLFGNQHETNKFVRMLSHDSLRRLAMAVGEEMQRRTKELSDV